MANKKYELIDETWQANEASVRELFSDLEDKDSSFKEEDYEGELGAGWKIKTAESFGGEGQGDERWVVIELIDPSNNSTYWEIPGWYQSNYGSEFTIRETFQVEAKEVKVIKWFPVK